VNFNLSNVTNGALMGITGFTLTIINNDSLAGAIPESEQDNHIRVFPNPVSNSLIVQTDKNLSDVIITDIIGKRITNLGNLSMGSSSVDVSLLPSGVYFLNIKEDDKLLIRKLVKIE